MVTSRMSEVKPNDYEIRVWGTKGGWVDINLWQTLQYARSDDGSGMQTLADDGSLEYLHVKELCDEVRESVLNLDSFLRGLMETDR